MEGSDSYKKSTDLLCRTLLATLEAFETMQRQFDPRIMTHLRELLVPVSNRMKTTMEQFSRPAPLHGSEEVRTRLMQAAVLSIDALDLFTAHAEGQGTLINERKSARKICRAQEVLFPLCPSLPPVNKFFLEKPVRERIGQFDPAVHGKVDAGLIHIGTEGHPYARGSVSIYVPESYDGTEAWPLVIALHGGFGHGRDFIWSWFREARSRHFILIAPTSQETTWAIVGKDIDLIALNETLTYVTGRWNIDEDHILLTGISDGATYALTLAMDEHTPFCAFAPVSGVLPPFNLQHIAKRRIFWVHGARDWMFPVRRAEEGSRSLIKAGADVTLRIIQDLSHTYPREQNDRILTWFEPALALPGSARAEPDGMIGDSNR